MSSTSKSLEAIISAIAHALRNCSREANFGARENIRWMIDEENRKIAFMGQILDNVDNSLPTYYEHFHLVKLSRQDLQLREALSALDILGYEITSWREDEDIAGRNNEIDLDIDIYEYKKLLTTFPPIVIYNQKEADRVLRFIDKILANDDHYNPAKDAYCSLLRLLLDNWETRKNLRDETANQPELPNDVPFDDIPF